MPPVTPSRTRAMDRMMPQLKSLDAKHRVSAAANAAAFGGLRVSESARADSDTCAKKERAGLLRVVVCQEPLGELAGALGGPLAQPPLEFVDGGRDEDRHRPRIPLLHAPGALGLELEQRHVTAAPDPVELGAERAVAVAGDVDDVLEEGIR